MRDPQGAGVPEEESTLCGDDALTKAMPSRQGDRRDHPARRPHACGITRWRCAARAENPMTRAEVDAKSYDLIAPVTGKARARKLCDAVWNLEKLRDVRKLRPLLMEKP